MPRSRKSKFLRGYKCKLKNNVPKHFDTKLIWREETERLEKFKNNIAQGCLKES